jgi:mannose-6-phosphate isomerase-like protein (cupin superfamily)
MSGTTQGSPLGAAEGRVIECMGAHFAIKVTAAESGGAVGVFEETVPPGDGPPMHVHGREDEVFHFLEGRFRLWCGGRSWVAGAGETVFLPRGVPHTFRNVGEGPGRKLVVVTPGGFEGLFPAVAARGLRLPDDMAELAAMAAAEYGLVFLGPPPAAG